MKVPMKVSIIVPVYNEERTILEVIKRIKNVKLSGFDKEIIVVDDFSTDDTRNLLKTVKGNDVKIIYQDRNYGKGMALRTGFRNATGDVLIIQDADLEYEPKEYPKLLMPIKEGRDVVYGTRLSYIKENVKDMNKLHYMGNKFLTSVTNLLYGSSLTDMETGFKVFRKEVLKGMKLNSMKFEIEPELTAKILKRGYKIHEVPVAFKARSFAEGKKITWKDGVAALMVLIKYRFAD